MKLEIPIIVGFDDLESLLDDLKKLQTYKLFEGDEMVLVDIEDVAKVLMKHVKAKKSVKSNDLISREDAIDALDCINGVEEVLKSLPSAGRPDPVKWLKDEFGSRCGACGLYAYRDKFGKPWESDYCPCCGARMGGDNNA